MAVTAAKCRRTNIHKTALSWCLQSDHDLRRLQQADVLEEHGNIWTVRGKWNNVDAALICVSISVWSERLVVNQPSPGHQLWLVSQTMTGGGRKAAQVAAFWYPSISYTQHISVLWFMIWSIKLSSPCSQLHRQQTVGRAVASLLLLLLPRYFALLVNSVSVPWLIKMRQELYEASMHPITHPNPPLIQPAPVSAGHNNYASSFILSYYFSFRLISYSSSDATVLMHLSCMLLLR